MLQCKYIYLHNWFLYWKMLEYQMNNSQGEYSGLANFGIINLIIFVDHHVVNKDVKSANPLNLIEGHDIKGLDNVELKQVVIFWWQSDRLRHAAVTDQNVVWISKVLNKLNIKRGAELGWLCSHCLEKYILGEVALPDQLVVFPPKNILMVNYLLNIQIPPIQLRTRILLSFEARWCRGNWTRTFAISEQGGSTRKIIGLCRRWNLLKIDTSRGRFQKISQF